jgi:hypothetical protein
MTERTKWEQLLPDATAIIFCAPLSDYDQTYRLPPLLNFLALLPAEADRLAGCKRTRKPYACMTACG